MKIERYFNIIRNLFFLPLKVKGYPINLQVDVCTHCNLKCKECKREIILSKDEINKNLSFEEFKIIFDKAKPFSVNLAASGEPFLNPAIFDMIKYVKNRSNGVVMVSSNQTILKNNLNEKIVSSGLDILKASIDGAKKETYEKIRGKYFDNVVRNLREITMIKEKLKSKSPSLRIDFVVLEENYKEIVDILYLAKDLNIDYVYYRVVDKSGWLEEEIINLYNNIDFSVLIQLLRKAYEESKNLGINTNIDLWFSNFSEVELAYTGKCLFSKLKRKVCVLPWVQIFVSVNGETNCCCTIMPSKEGSYGNIFTEDFDNIWNGSEIVKARKIFKQKKNYCFEGCINCIAMTRLNLLKATNMFPNYYNNVIFEKKN